jgi:hypothetical protein
MHVGAKVYWLKRPRSLKIGKVGESRRGEYGRIRHARGYVMLGKLLDLWPSLGVGMLGGVLSWFATEWVAKPIAAFRVLRGSVIEELHFFANGYEGSPPNVREEASRRIRRVSSEAHKLNVNSTIPLRCYLWWRRADLGLASEGLVGFSNCLPEHRDGSLALMRDRIERGMGLPRSLTDKLVRVIEQRVARQKSE